MKNQINQSAIEWKEVQLKEIAMILMGQSPPGESYNEEGKGIPFFQGKAEFTEKYPKIKKWTTEPSKLAEPDSILMSVRAPVGDINFCNIMCCIGRGLASIKPKKDVSLQYLYFIISKSKEKIAQLGTGSTFKAINANQLSSFKIPLPFSNGHPDLQTQKAIVSILEKAEQLKEKRKQSLKLLDEYVKSTFNEMFVGKGFEEKRLDEVCLKITDGTHITPKYLNEGIPFLRVTDITESNSSKKFISNKEHNELIRRCKPENGDVLYTKNGTIGIAKVINWNYEFSIFVSLCLLKPNRIILIPKYLESFLNTPYALDQALSHSKKGTITNLHLIEIKKIKIPLPPLPLQQTFASLVEHVEKLKGKQNQSLKEIEQLFNALMQKAFNGELV